MSFQLDTADGLNAFNTHLADKSYVGGYTPSQADATTFAGVSAAPDATKYVNVSRWWNHISSFSAEERKAWAAAAATAAPAAKKEEDDIDLFGDDDEADEEWEKEIQRRADENAAKKAASGKKKEALRSAIVIDVKPWEDTTDMVELERLVRTIEMDGLEWKASKLTAIGFGIKKLQISCHIEDEKVSVDDIQEKIQAFEDFVQSTDIDTFTKL
jgi:elongation factor 1-beta